MIKLFKYWSCTYNTSSLYYYKIGGLKIGVRVCVLHNAAVLDPCSLIMDWSVRPKADMSPVV